MHEDADSISTESPSYFSYLGENIKLTGRPVPGSRHLAPGKTSKQDRKGQSPSTVRDCLFMCGAKLYTINTYIRFVGAE